MFSGLYMKMSSSIAPTNKLTLAKHVSDGPTSDFVIHKPPIMGTFWQPNLHILYHDQQSLLIYMCQTILFVLRTEDVLILTRQQHPQNNTKIDLMRKILSENNVNVLMHYVPQAKCS